MTDWPTVVRNFMEEHRLTAREIEVRASVNRCTLSRCLAGRSIFRLDDLDRILALCGYSLRFEKVANVKPQRRRLRPRPAAPSQPKNPRITIIRKAAP